MFSVVLFFVSYRTTINWIQFHKGVLAWKYYFSARFLDIENRGLQRRLFKLRYRLQICELFAEPPSSLNICLTEVLHKRAPFPASILFFIDILFSRLTIQITMLSCWVAIQQAAWLEFMLSGPIGRLKESGLRALIVIFSALSTVYSIAKESMGSVFILLLIVEGSAESCNLTSANCCCEGLVKDMVSLQSRFRFWVYVTRWVHSFLLFVLLSKEKVSAWCCGQTVARAWRKDPTCLFSLLPVECFEIWWIYHLLRMKYWK